MHAQTQPYRARPGSKPRRDVLRRSDRSHSPDIARRAWLVRRQSVRPVACIMKNNVAMAPIVMAGPVKPSQKKLDEKSTG
jgi:hypothetical protein